MDAFFSTREQWLTAATDQFRPEFIQLGAPLPQLRLSVGWPGASKRARGHTIGQCWAPAATADGVQQIYISPELDDAPRVLDVLVHELCHAADKCEHGHRGQFAHLAHALGLTGSLTATVAGPELATRLATLAERLGAYPHAAIHIGGTLTGGKAGSGTTPRIAAHPKQATRMIKCTCPTCGYIARTTSKWLDSAGAPICPADRVVMTIETR